MGISANKSIILLEKIICCFNFEKKRKSHEDDELFFDFMLPRPSKRIDCVWLCSNYILVFSFANEKESSSLIVDECLDLSYFHEDSRTIPLIPIVFSTYKTETHINHPLNWWHNISEVLTIRYTTNDLRFLIKKLDSEIHYNHLINKEQWFTSPFKPIAQFNYLSAIIKEDQKEATTWLHVEIKRLINDVEIICKSINERSFIFINGLPGSGKTITRLYMERYFNTSGFQVLEYDICDYPNCNRIITKVFKQEIGNSRKNSYLCFATTYVPDATLLIRLQQIVTSRGIKFISSFSVNDSLCVKNLQLRSCIRTFRCQHVLDFWENAFSGRHLIAKQLLESIPQNNSHIRYRIVLSRNLNDAKQLLKKLKHGSERTGILSLDCLENDQDFDFCVVKVSSKQLSHASFERELNCVTKRKKTLSSLRLFARVISIFMKAKQGIIIYFPKGDTSCDHLFSLFHDDIGLKTICETNNFLEYSNASEN